MHFTGIKVCYCCPPSACACAEKVGLPRPDSSCLCSVNASEVTRRVIYLASLGPQRVIMRMRVCVRGKQACVCGAAAVIVRVCSNFCEY